MILSTTPTIEGRPVRQYLGVVAGETIMGANMLRDFFAGITDMIGGRSGTYEAVLQKGREAALDELADRAGRLGADAVIGIAMHYAALGASESMLMVTVSGTAVKLA